jgi:AcrR family transcriptional regulator
LKKRKPTLRSERRDRTRDAILKAAEQEFAAKGLFGARVDEISKRARTNKRMIYYYFGSKEGLYLIVLERVYQGLRGAERTLHLSHFEPEQAIRTLIEANFAYSRAHPEMISLINSENLHKAKHLRKSKLVRQLHSPLVRLLEDILKEGVAKGIFRRGIDPVDLYITIAGIGYFFLANNWTLSTIFGRDLSTDRAFRRRKEHMVDMVLSSLRA